ncbi:MAG TPA: GxxExxY protein [Rudaea sp.]
MELSRLTGCVIGCAIEVHRFLGPGLLESAYSQCLAYELTQAGIVFEREKAIRVTYKECEIDCGFRSDFFIEDQLMVELKSVDRLLPIHRAPLLTYMKVAGARVGLMINFNCRTIKEGLVRIVL